MHIVVFGNVTLDVLCYPVNHVPRHQSIVFDRSIVSPGGCGSNVAVGLGALGIPTTLVACMGDDVPAKLLEQTWSRWGVDFHHVRRLENHATGVSVGLVDKDYQPRFIHTPGANALLSADDLDIETCCQEGAKFLHIAGYFVLPGIMDARLSLALEKAQQFGLVTSLDVVHSPRMHTPELLWACLPHLDYFLCNQREAATITGINHYRAAAQLFRARGARTVIIKRGKWGCWVDCESWQALVPGIPVPVVDTTGAGDAFAAGLLAALASGNDLRAACQAGNRAGARIVGTLGAIAGWEV